MKTHLKSSALLLFLSAAFSLAAANDLYADYTEDAPLIVTPASAVEPLQKWQMRFADACALTMSQDKEKRAEGRKILYSLLDERPDAIEALKLLQFIQNIDRAATAEIRSHVITLTKKYPHARDLGIFALGCFNKKVPKEEKDLILRNTLEALSKEPLPDFEENWILRNVMFGFLLASLEAVEAEKPELAVLVTRCRLANPAYKKNINELRIALPILYNLIRKPFFELSQAGTDVLFFYGELLYAYQDLILEGALEKLPSGTDTTPYFQLCVELAAAGQMDRLIAGLEKELQKQPDQHSKTELLMLFYCKQKQESKAISLAHNYLKNSKKPETAIYAVTMNIYLQQRKYDDLLVFMDQHLTRLPESMQIAFRLDLLKRFLSREDYSRAANVLKEMKTFQSLSGRIQLLIQARRPGEAYRVLKEQALPRFLAGERTANREQDRAFLDVAMILCDQYHDFPAVEKVLTTWLKDHPDDHLILNNLAYYYTLENVKLDEALKMITAALKVQPENAAYLDTMAWVLYRQKKYKDAAVYIEKAIAAFGGQENEMTESLDHAGDIYFALGNKVKAAQYWQRALKTLEKLNGQENEKNAIRKKLDALKKKAEK